MKVFLTGATGYIGSAVADALQAAGHHVIGLAHAEDRARLLRQRNVEPWPGSLNNPETVAQGASRCDAFIHCALGHDHNAPIADRGTIEAVLEAFAGTGRSFIYTSGVWVMGNTKADADENAPLAAPPFVAWRMGVETTVLDAARREIRSVVIRPAMVYGRGRGFAQEFVRSAKETGAAICVGDGENHWSFVHVDDLADLYARALDAPPGTLLIAAAGRPLKVKEVAAAASRTAGAAGKIQFLSLDEAFKTMGPAAGGVVLDSRVSGKKAQQLLGWHPSRPSVLEEFAPAGAAG